MGAIMQTQLLRSFQAVCVLLGALSLGGCEYLVVDEKGNQRYVDWFTDRMRPGETLVALPSAIGPGYPITRPGNPTRQVAYVPTLESYPTQRWAVGVSGGVSFARGEMNHFFPEANTDSHLSNFTLTGSGEYHRAINYNPNNSTLTWGRMGLDFTIPSSGDSSPNFGGEVLRTHVGWQVAPKVGFSIQFLERNGTTSGIFSMGHCLWLTGGPVFTRINDDFAGVSHSKSAVGWTVGGGIDFNYTNGWATRVGVHYTDYGTNNLVLPGGNVKIDHNDVSLKIGLYARFETGK